MEEYVCITNSNQSLSNSITISNFANKNVTYVKGCNPNSMESYSSHSCLRKLCWHSGESAEQSFILFAHTTGQIYFDWSGLWHTSGGFFDNSLKQENILPYGKEKSKF